MGDDVSCLVQDGQDRCHFGKKVKGYSIVLQVPGAYQVAPALGINPFADPVPQSLRGTPDLLVADEMLSRKFLKFLQFIF